MDNGSVTQDRDAVAAFDDAINPLIMRAAGNTSLRALWRLKIQTKRRLIGESRSNINAIVRAAHADLQRLVSRAA